MHQQATYRLGSSLPATSSSSSPTQPSAPTTTATTTTTGFDRAKAFRERLQSTRANTALLSTTTTPQPPPPPPPPQSAPSTLPPAPPSLPARPNLSGPVDAEVSAAPESEAREQHAQPLVRRPSPLAKPFEPKATAAIVQRAREAKCVATTEEKARVENQVSERDAALRGDGPGVHLSSPPQEAFPMPSTVPLTFFGNPYPAHTPVLAYPISSFHPPPPPPAAPLPLPLQTPLLAPIGTSSDSVVNHALEVVGVSRDEWDATATIGARLARVWEDKVLPVPASQLSPTLASSLLYLLSTILAPSHPASHNPSAPPNDGTSLLRIAAYLALIDRARAEGAGEWAAVYGGLAERWRVEWAEESEREKEAANERKEVDDENRRLKEHVEELQACVAEREKDQEELSALKARLHKLEDQRVGLERRAHELEEQLCQSAKERDEALDRDRREKEAKPSRRVALLLEDLDKANAARSSLQSQLDTALADLAEARSQLAAAPLARQPQPGEEGRKEREMAEADRLILEGRLEEVGREKKELEERLRVEVERRKKVEGEVEKKMAAATNAPSPSPSTTTGNDSKDVDKLNAELKQNKFVVERLAAKVKEMNKELGDRRDENAELLARLAAVDAA